MADFRRGGTGWGQTSKGMVLSGGADFKGVVPRGGQTSEGVVLGGGRIEKTAQGQ